MNYDKLQKSLRHLELQHRNLESLGARAELNELDREAIQESVIQRFEVCFDTLWKHLKRHLVEVEGLSAEDMPNSPKPVLRIAHEKRLLPGDINVWIKYAKLRADTSHDYSKEKMQNTLQHMGGFIFDAVKVFETMTQTTWQKSPS